ncbi:MAG: TatD family hydrolase [Spirochaetales bacterium]|nr:TatD family hydrolase [Spirochaetales bacterium]
MTKAPDAHLHLFDLESALPGSVATLAAEERSGRGRRRASACHDRAEFEATEAYRARGLSFDLSFGIHPQNAVWDDAEFLALVANEGRIEAIGECGFEFFGGRPEWTRTPETEGRQRAILEFQLGVARERGLPVIVHQRKALDLIFAYAREFRRLPAVVFHAWSGPPREAESLLAKGIRAFFSFGTPILNGNRKAAASCATLPGNAILLETDAPWQPPRGERACLPAHLDLVLEAAATLRGVAPEPLAELVLGNYEAVYGAPRERHP